MYALFSVWMILKDDCFGAGYTLADAGFNADLDMDLPAYILLGGYKKSWVTAGYLVIPSLGNKVGRRN